MSTFSVVINDIKAEIQKSPLLQYLLPAIFAILAFYLVDVLRQGNIETQEEYRQLEKREGKITSLQDQADWANLEKISLVEAEKLKPRLWEAESVELAAADVQTRLKSLAGDKIKAMRLQMAEPIWIEDAQVWKLSAEINGRFLADQLQLLMLSVAENQPGLVTDRFSYSPSRNGFGVMHLSAFVRLRASIDAVGGNK